MQRRVASFTQRLRRRTRLAAPPLVVLPRALFPRHRLPFSTQTRNSAPTLRPLRHGGVCAFLWRTLQRQPAFWRDSAAGVFAPGVAMQERVHLFAYINAPTRTVLDLPEFLQGARRAAASVLEASHSRDFVTWSATGHAATSASATQLQQWCTPAAFHRLVQSAASSDSIAYEITVTHVSLVRAAYDRCTPSELAVNTTLANEVSVGRPWTLGASVERLQLGVRVTTRERVSPPHRPAIYTDREYHFEFLSDVSASARIDWRVAAVERTGTQTSS